MFWRDNWIDDEPLLNLALKEPELAELYCTVDKYWHPRGGWLWDKFRGMLPCHIENRLITLLMRYDDLGRDDFYWKRTPNRKFSTSSAYNLTVPLQSQHIDDLWRKIWKLKIPQKILTFLWLVYHGKILTNKERTKRGFTSNPSCHCCTREVEDLDHIFRFCTKVSLLWDKITTEEIRKKSTNLQFKNWISGNLNRKTRMGDLPWNELFAIHIWWVWMWHIDEVFNAKEESWEKKIVVARNYCHEVLNVMPQKYHIIFIIILLYIPGMN